MVDEGKYWHKITMIAIALAFIDVLFFVVFGLSEYFGLNSASVVFIVFAVITLFFDVLLILFLFEEKARVKKIEQDKKIFEQLEEKNKKRLAEKEVEIERERKIKLEQVKVLEVSGRFEEAAKIYDEFEMYEKAGECRRMAKTSYQISTNFSLGKNGVISCNCPSCGSSQVLESKSNLVKCKHCGTNYIIPKKILDSM
jgi:uncharacterized membrane protein